MAITVTEKAIRQKLQDTGLNSTERGAIAEVVADVIADIDNPALLAEVTAAANVLTASESGKVIFLNSATGFATTLPAPAAGLKFTFIVTVAPTSGNHTIVTSGGADIIDGNSFISPDAIGTPAVNEDSINFVATSAAIGDNCTLWSDGTKWYVNAFARLTAGVTFTAA